MLFEVQRALGWYIEEDDQPLEAAYIHSWEETPREPVDEIPRWAIEVDSLEELMEIVEGSRRVS